MRKKPFLLFENLGDEDPNRSIRMRGLVDGTPDFDNMILHDATAANPGWGSTAGTVGIWFKPITGANYNGVLLNLGGATFGDIVNTIKISFSEIGGNTILRVVIVDKDDVGIRRVREWDNDVVLDQWNLIMVNAGGLASGGYNVYVNGNSIGSSADRSPETGLPDNDDAATRRISIGGAFGSLGDVANACRGLVYWVATWDVLLFEGHASGLYNSGTAIDPDTNSGAYNQSAALTGWWRPAYRITPLGGDESSAGHVWNEYDNSQLCNPSDFVTDYPGI